MNLKIVLIPARDLWLLELLCLLFEHVLIRIVSKHWSVCLLIFLIKIVIRDYDSFSFVIFLAQMPKELILIKNNGDTFSLPDHPVKRVQSLRYDHLFDLLGFMFHVKLMFTVFALLTMNRH